MLAEPRLQRRRVLPVAPASIGARPLRRQWEERKFGAAVPRATGAWGHDCYGSGAMAREHQTQLTTALPEIGDGHRLHGGARQRRAGLRQPGQGGGTAAGRAGGGAPGLIRKQRGRGNSAKRGKRSDWVPSGAPVVLAAAGGDGDLAVR